MALKLRDGNLLTKDGHLCTSCCDGGTVDCDPLNCCAMPETIDANFPVCVGTGCDSSTCSGSKTLTKNYETETLDGCECQWTGDDGGGNCSYTITARYDCSDEETSVTADRAQTGVGTWTWQATYPDTTGGVYCGTSWEIDFVGFTPSGGGSVSCTCDPVTVG